MSAAGNAHPPALHWQLDLHPFEPQPYLKPFALNCRAHWQDQQLALRYSLSGPLNELVLAEKRSATPGRRDNLWQSSCFEAFMAQPQSLNYWELNLTAQGDWNLYRLADYRSGLSPDPGIQHLDIQTERTNQGPHQQQMAIEVTLPLVGVFTGDGGIELSATAVLEHKQFGCSYWAWRHCGHEPDFHRRESLLPPSLINGS